MLSSITPLGERARRQRWGVTVAAFTLGAGVGASIAFTGISFLGLVVGGRLSVETRLLVALFALGAAAAADVAGLVPPSRHRQVDEGWLGRYRGWVYGAGYGFQLGTGVMTIVPVFGVAALGVIAFLVGRPIAGLAIGAGFALGRSAVLLLAASVTSPDRLVRFHDRFHAARGVAHGLMFAGYSLVIASLAIGGTAWA